MSTRFSKDSSPSAAFAAITPGDAALPGPTRAIYVGGAGTLVLTPLGGGADVTFQGLPAGTILPVQATHVKATSTATNLVGLF